MSELKHRAMEVWDAAKQDAQPAEIVTPQYEPEIYVPYFATLGERSEELGQGSAREILTRDSKGDANRGALRGTAVHRVMECLDFVKLAEVDRRDPKAVEKFREEQIEVMLFGKVVFEFCEDIGCQVFLIAQCFGHGRLSTGDGFDDTYTVCIYRTSVW